MSKTSKINSKVVPVKKPANVKTSGLNEKAKAIPKAKKGGKC